MIALAASHTRSPKLKKKKKKKLEFNFIQMQKKDYFFLICSVSTLNRESNGKAHLRFGRNLTFVHSLIVLTHVFDLQIPLVTAVRTNAGESLVARVRVTADRQNVQITLSYPWHLFRRAGPGQTTEVARID
jgi:hypothetical protein